MINNNDYILKLIETLSRNTAKAIFDVKEDAEPITIENMSDKDILVLTLKKMISEKKLTRPKTPYLNLLRIIQILI